MIYFLISVLFALFMTTSLAPALGFEDITTTVAFAPIMLQIVRKTIDKSMNYYSPKNNNSLLILGLAVIVFFVKSILGQDYFKQVLTFLIMPVLMSVYFETCSDKKIRILQNVVLLFFYIECLLAIYERATFQHLFLFEINKNELANPESWEFRSQAFLGHPLANAMVVAVLMTYIVTNIRLKKSIKIISTLLGYIALFCFNARGATIIASIFIMPYLFYQLYTSSRSFYRFLYVLISVFLIFGLFYVVFNTDLGGRLIKSEKLLDGSAKTRLDVFNFYLFVDPQDLWLGNLDSYLNVTKKLGAGGVENGIVVLILKYGILLTIPILILLFRFQWQKLKIYPTSERWLILSVFYIIGTMNPNLAEPIQWIIFVFGYYAFRNVHLRKMRIQPLPNKTKGLSGFEFSRA